MLKQTSSVLKISALALVLSFGLSYALAWTTPTQNPPSGNVEAPINIGATAQIKIGDLTAARLFSTASSSIGTTAQTQTLTVAGTIGATGDICTAAGGGKCLSTGGGIDPAPIGSVVSFAGAIPPSGYLLCDGAEVSRTTYAALFAAIGTTYGAGDGSTTFKLPDLRGEFIRGLDQDRGIDAGRTLGSAQAHDWKSFTVAGFTNGTYTHADVLIPKTGYNTTYPFGGYWSAPGNLLRFSWDSTSEIRPRNVAMNYIIKAVNNSEMVLVATSTLATTITAGSGITISPAGPGASGDVTISASSALPAGAVMYFNLASCPSGWIAANGASGTPDLRGEFIRGLDSGRGVDSGRTLRSWQGQDIQSHIHSSTIWTWAQGYMGSGAGFPGTGSTGATGGAETRPRNVALLACVKS